MPRYGLPAGTRVDALADSWVAFSAASGRTLILNDECAAILDVLAQGPADARGVAEALAEDAGMDAEALAAIVDSCWPVLVNAGLAAPV